MPNQECAKGHPKVLPRRFSRPANLNKTRSERCSLIASHSSYPSLVRPLESHFSHPRPHTLAFARSNRLPLSRNTLYLPYFCFPSSSSSTVFHLPSPSGPYLRFHLVSPIVQLSCIRGGVLKEKDTSAFVNCSFSQAALFACFRHLLW